MDIFNLLTSGLGIFIGIAGAACTVIVPVLILGGLGVFFYKRNQKSTAARQMAQSWPNTSGMVLISTVQSRRSGRSITTFPVVVYQYEVNGITYQGKTIKVGEQYLNVRILGQAQATAERYPVGTTITIYYNPANPAESALER